MLLLPLFVLALEGLLAAAQTTMSLSTTPAGPSSGPGTPRQLSPQECRQTQICALTVQGLYQCNDTTLNIRNFQENLAFQRCICNQNPPPPARPWNDTFAACLQCFYDNRWLFDPDWASDAQISIRNFCNGTRPNVTRFDRFPMVELVAGIAPPSRGGRVGPSIWTRPSTQTNMASTESRAVVATPSAQSSTSGRTPSSTVTTASTTDIPSTTTAEATSSGADSPAQNAGSRASMPGAWTVYLLWLGLLWIQVSIILGIIHVT